MCSKPVLFLQQVVRWAHSTVPQAPGLGCLQPFPTMSMGTSTCRARRMVRWWLLGRDKW